MVLPLRSWGIAAVGVVLVLAHGLLLLPFALNWRGVGALIVLGLPGALAAQLWFGSQRDTLTRMFLMVCGALSGAALLLMALNWLPGTLPGWLLLLVCDALSVALVAWGGRWRSPAVADAETVPLSLVALLLLGAVLLLGGILRLPFLGTAEFDYDEAQVMHAVVALAQGQEDALLVRRKGPVEALLPAGVLALTGQINELTARLPFALAGMGVLLGCFLLARQLFAQNRYTARSATAIALIATTILALDGFLIGFSRIVQYQSVLLLLLLGAFLCCWNVYANQRNSWQLLPAALLVAVALLTHYDAVFAVPALAWLVLAAGLRHGWRPLQWLQALTPPVLLATLLLLAFYVPFVAQDSDGRTSNYLLWRVLGNEGQLGDTFNNLPTYYQAVTFYNTTYQIHALAVALLGGLVYWTMRYIRPREVALSLLALLLLTCTVLLLDPGSFTLANRWNWALFGFGLPLAVLALIPAVPVPLRVLVLWFAPPFLAQSFLIAVPNTHFYTMHVPAALLIAAASVTLARWLHERRARWAQLGLGLAGAALVLVSVPYLLLAYVRPMPEYQRSFPAARPAIYRASYGDTLPGGSFLGFPHRDGWKVIGELYRQGVLHGSYRSNERTPITRWYLRNTAPDDNPNYYFAALYASPPAPKPEVPRGYQLFGYVLVDNIRTLAIYSRQMTEYPARVFTLDEYRAAFDDRPTLASFAPPAPPVPRPLPADFGDAVHLRGYDLAVTNEKIGLTLQWQALGQLPHDYMLFVHVLDESGNVVAQADLPPAGATNPTSRWQAGQYHALVQEMPLPADLAPGRYWLALGLYNPADGTRLSLHLPPDPQAPSDGDDALLLDSFGL